MSTGNVRKIKANRSLQAKVGTGQIDDKAIAAAQKVIDEDKTDFAVLARKDLGQLQSAITNAKDNMDDSDLVLDSFKEPIMNMKSNAGSFKYEFVSQLTGMILTLLENVEKVDKKLVQIVDVLHKTIMLALAYQMKGDGGDNGRELVKAFETICLKYKPAA